MNNELYEQAAVCRVQAALAPNDVTKEHFVYSVAYMPGGAIRVVPLEVVSGTYGVRFALTRAKRDAAILRALRIFHAQGRKTRLSKTLRSFKFVEVL